MWDAQPETDDLLSLGLSDAAYRKIFSGNLMRLPGKSARRLSFPCDSGTMIAANMNR